MPTYRSITLSLISQFDILTIPEFAPPTTPNDPFSNAPTLINPDHSLVSVYIPTYPSSQFWLCYSISPPYPPKQLFYFKLYLNDNLVVSWGCGEDDGYKGKTMFGLFDSGHSVAKKPSVERRILCFGPESRNVGLHSLGNLSDVMEVKVFRSKGRKRITPQIQELQNLPGGQYAAKKGSSPQGEGGISLVSTGLLPERHPQRYYKYALLDPLDQPFATFRYYYRSWDQLEALGVISPTPSTESSSIRSVAPAARPLTPRSSNNTLASAKSISSSVAGIAPGSNTVTPRNSTDGDSSSGASEKSTFSTDSAPKSQEPARSGARSKDSVAVYRSSTPPPTSASSPGTTPPADTVPHITVTRSSTPPPISVPLKDSVSRLGTVPPMIFPRAPTPPPTSAPVKSHDPLPQKPLPTNPLPKTLATKESFATLVRTRLPSPDPLAFKLTNPLAELSRPPSPLHVPHSGSMNVLMNVVRSAKDRRKRGNSEGSEKSGDGSGSGSGSGNRRKRSTSDGSEESGSGSGSTSGNKQKRGTSEGSEESGGGSGSARGNRQKRGNSEGSEGSGSGSASLSGSGSGSGEKEKDGKKKKSGKSVTFASDDDNNKMNEPEAKFKIKKPKEENKRHIGEYGSSSGGHQPGHKGHKRQARRLNLWEEL